MKPTETRTCETCRHAGEVPLTAATLGAPRPLECKRYPPTAFLVNAGGGGAGLVTASPQVPPGGTCGEWAAPSPSTEHHPV